MDKVLLDSSTFFDIRNAHKKREAAWSQNTAYHVYRYVKHHPRLTVTAFTVMEDLAGLRRQDKTVEAERFESEVLPTLNVIYPTFSVFALVAQIDGKLRIRGKAIGLADLFIAATAIVEGLVLVTADAHFARVIDAGFSLKLSNWRER